MLELCPAARLDASIMHVDDYSSIESNSLHPSPPCICSTRSTRNPGAVQPLAVMTAKLVISVLGELPSLLGGIGR